MPIRIVESQRLYRQIAAQLRALIANGEYAAGARLPAERDLAQQFGVSRSSVREALIALKVEGWVEVRTGSGVSCGRLGHDRDQGDEAARPSGRIRGRRDGRIGPCSARARPALGPIIAPSLPFMIYAMMANACVGALFLAGILPGVLMTVLMMLTVSCFAYRNQWGGDVEFSRTRFFKAMVELGVVIAWPLLLWVLVVQLGSPPR